MPREKRNDRSEQRTTHTLRHSIPATYMTLDFAELLTILSFSDDEYIAVCHKTGNDKGAYFHTQVCRAVEAPHVVTTIPDDADIWFSVNPTSGPARKNGGRGKATDVTRLAALYADLDVSPGKCASLDVAHSIIDRLSDVLGSRPSAITHTGGGLHPYWPLAKEHGPTGGLEGTLRRGRGEPDPDADPAEVLKRWGRLVKAVAEKVGAKADSVFNLDRILRVPGTFNYKYLAEVQGGIPVTCDRGQGSILTLSDADKRLSDYGIRQIDDCPDSDAKPISNPEDWVFSNETCKYVAIMIAGWVDPATVKQGMGRHPWCLSQAVRLNCAYRLACITKADFEHAKELVEKTFAYLCATREPVRDVAPAETSDIWKAAANIAAAKTAQQARSELGDHGHLWPAPDQPYQCAKRVIAQAGLEGRPLRYWNGTWFEWCGSHYRRTTIEGLRDYLYGLLAEAEYPGANGNTLRWKPTPKKLNDVIDAARGLAILPAGLGASEWIDGHNEPVIACANGLVRMSDRQRISHTPEFFNTFALPFDYEPEAPRPERWLTFLNEVFPSDPESAETLQEWFGYILSGRTDLQKMLMMVGPPRSGKGTIVRTLISLIGAESHAAVTDTALANDFGLAPLVDKTLAVFSDARVSIKGKKLVETLLSVTGEDTVPVNRKYRDAVSVRLGVRFMIMSNELAALPDNSGAIVSRIIGLSTPSSWIGREDSGLADKLRNEVPAIMSWALEGMDRLVKRGHFTQPARGREIIDLLSETASPITQFVDEKCVLGSHQTHFVSKQALYEQWKLWCSNHGHSPHSDAHMARGLYAAFGSQVKSTRRGGREDRQMCFSGIALRSVALGGGQ